MPKSRPHEDSAALGNLLQRLALIAPEKIHGIRLIVQTVLRKAEQDYRKKFKRDPWKEGGSVNLHVRGARH